MFGMCLNGEDITSCRQERDWIREVTKIHESLGKPDLQTAEYILPGNLQTRIVGILKAVSGRLKLDGR